MEAIVSFFNSLIWNPALVFLCLGAGLFFSILLKFAQVRHFAEMWRLLFRGKASSAGISSFQALTVALSGRVGIGNIVGVAAAIGWGGAGAIFWMWMGAFFGAATAYMESMWAQVYKEEHHGLYRGGPAYYFEKFFDNKAIGIFFALSAILACGLFMPGVQANGVANAVTGVIGEGATIATTFGNVGMYKIIATAAILLAIGLIIFGGIKRIANFTQVVVPFMALGYIILAFLVIFLNADKIGELFHLIVSDAFTAKAGIGAAIFWGIKRGIYSNEAGQGIGAHHAAAAEVEHPAQQGLVQAFSVYIDTLIVCSATAFMILITQKYNIQGTLPEGQFIVQNLPAETVIDSAAFTQAALNSIFGKTGVIFSAIALFFFAFTTILSYYYVAETNVVYLCRRIESKAPITLLKLFFMISVAYGAVNSSGYVWSIGDIGGGLMAWINIVGMFVMFYKMPKCIEILKDYEKQRKAGGKISFDPKKFAIKGAEFWEGKNKTKSKKKT